MKVSQNQGFSLDPREPQIIDMVQLENTCGQTMLYNLFTDAQIGVPQG